MASYFDEISRNKLKSALLFAIFSAFFIGVVYAFALYLGAGIYGIAIAIILVAVYALSTYYIGGRFVLKMSGAKEADRKQNNVLYDTIEGLAAANQLPMPKVYIINDPSPNAFATGRNKKHAAVAVTSGLLAMLSRDELQGVIAHEISHIYDNDIMFMLVAVVFAGAIGIIAAFVRISLFFGGAGGSRNDNAGIIILIALIIGLLAPFFALLIRLAISRRREYMADANGARITRAPKFLASALKKIQSYTRSPSAEGVKRANEVTAPLYFSNPLKVGSIANIFSTHPPIGERIKRLEAMY